MKVNIDYLMIFSPKLFSSSYQLFKLCNVFIKNVLFLRHLVASESLKHILRKLVISDQQLHVDIIAHQKGLQPKLKMACLICFSDPHG